MAISLKRGLMEIILTDWPDDLPSEWRGACGEVAFGFGNADPQFELEFLEPVFPVPGQRFSRHAGRRAHVARARESRSHKPGAFFSSRRHGAGPPPAPLCVVFRRAPIGARHNAGRVR